MMLITNSIKLFNLQMNYIQRILQNNNSNSSVRVLCLSISQTISRKLMENKHFQMEGWKLIKVVCLIIKTTMKMKSTKCNRTWRNSNNQNKIFWPIRLKTNWLQEIQKIWVCKLQEIQTHQHTCKVIKNNLLWLNKIRVQVLWRV